MKKIIFIVAGTILFLISISIVVFFIMAKQTKSVTVIASEQSRSVVHIATKSKIGLDIGTGSGFLISKDGLVATNFHVIEDAYVAAIKLSNGDIYDDVGVVSVDPRKDAAVLKIKAENLPFVTFGNSDAIRVGERVVAIGTPENLEQTVSDGVISGIRNIGTGFKILQISAPISHGSSGGPLFDLHGKVVGITTAVIEGAQNLNFAIPINYLKPLIENGKVIPLSKFQEDFQQKQWFGGSNDKINEGLKPSSSFKTAGDLGVEYDFLALPYNVIIRRFNEISPAREAGLQVGDVIVEINKTPIKSFDDFYKTSLHFLEGDEVSVKILRNKKEISAKFSLTKNKPVSAFQVIPLLLTQKMPVRLAILCPDFTGTEDAVGMVEAQQRAFLDHYGHSKYFSLVDTGKLDYIFKGLTQNYGAITPAIRDKVLKSMGATHLLEASINTSGGSIHNKLIDLNTGSILAIDVMAPRRDLSAGGTTLQLETLDPDLQEYQTYMGSLPPGVQTSITNYFRILHKKYIE